MRRVITAVRSEGFDVYANADLERRHLPEVGYVVDRGRVATFPAPSDEHSSVYLRVFAVALSAVCLGPLMRHDEVPRGS